MSITTGQARRDFSTVRQALLSPLPGESALAQWRPTPGDLGLQVLEWWAYLADVLSFYDDEVARSSYLPTARDADRLADLVALIGYHPRPGIAAAGRVAMLRSGARLSEPLSIPSAMPLSSTATPGVPAQTFEVSGDWAFSGPSTVGVTLPPDTTLALNAAGGPASVLLAGRVTNIKAGDELLLAARGWDGSSDGNWGWVQVAGVQPVTDPGTGAPNTLVSFTAASRFGPPPVIDWWRLWLESEFFTDDRFGRYGRRFGELALRVPTGLYWRAGTPAPAAAATLPAPSFQLLRPSQTASLWTQANAPGAVIDPSTTPLTVHLAGAVRAIATGDLVLIDAGGSGAALGLVAAAAEVLWAVPYPQSAAAAQAASATPPDIVVTHTQLSLTTPDVNALESFDPSSVTLRYGFRPVGTIIGTPVAALAQLPVSVGVPTGWAPSQSTASAILQDSTGAGVEVAVTSAGDSTLALSPAGETPADLAVALQVPLRLLLHLAPVSRGVTVGSETLGSGDATQINQSFTLRHAPLTYLAAGSTLTVYVDGVAWSEVPGFYAQPVDARVYSVTVAPSGTATVTFGDGVNGARLPTGSGNVTATYRYGSGAAAPPAGRLTTITRPQPNLAAVANPIAVYGGVDPQTAAGIRSDAPAAVAGLGRAVSGTDYGVVAGQAPGVTRVGVAWRWDGPTQRTAVTVYVAGDSGAVASANAALAGAGDPNRPICVVGATAVPLTVSATLHVVAGRITGDVQAAAVAALQALTGPASLVIGQSLYRSQIDAALSVDGVGAVTGLRVLTDTMAMDEVLWPGHGAYFALTGTDGIQAVSDG